MVPFEIDLTELLQFCDLAPSKASEAVRAAMDRELSRAAAEARSSSAFKDRTGALRKSIGYKVEGTSLLDGIEGTLFATAPHAIFIEDGTRPHTILPKGQYLRFKSGRRWVFAKRVDHPGIRARNFLKSAISEDRMREAIEEAIVKAWES